MSGPQELTPDLIVLGRMMWGDHEDQVRLAELVDPGVFQSKATRKLFLLFAREAAKGFTPGTVMPTVRAEAPECNQLFDRLLGETGTNALLDEADIERLVASASTWGTLTKFRKALDYATEGLTTGTPYAAVRANLERHLTAIDLSVLSGKPYDDKDDMARRAVAHLDGITGGLPFGYVKLDRKVTPVLRGNFVVVAGRPGTGKSTWKRNFARNWVKRGERVVYFSLEMAGEETLPIFACMDAGLEYGKYLRREFTKDERRRFVEALAWWVDCPDFTLNERADVTPEWLLRQLHRYRADGYTTFVVDHLHRIRYEANAKGDIRLAMGDTARALKSWAVDHGARILAGAQLTKGDKHEEPHDGMIREAGPIVDEADKIFLTYRQQVAGLRTGDGSFVPTIGENGRRILAHEADAKATLGEDPTITFLKIGKQRVQIEDGIVALPFNHLTGLIADLDTRHMEVAA